MPGTIKDMGRKCLVCAIESWAQRRNQGATNRSIPPARSVRVRGDEFISDAVHGANEDGEVRISFNFLAQSGDAVVDSAMIGTFSFRPGGADQFPARDHYPRMLDQEFEYFEFAQSQLDDPVSPAEFHRLKIKGTVAETCDLELGR